MLSELILKTPTAESRIIVGNAENEIREILNKAALVVADIEVIKLDTRNLFKDVELFTLPAGEEIKSLRTVEILYEALYTRGVNRHSLVVAVGGGTLTDLVGFVAATYLRGIKFNSVPTSLLAQVDASVGGKNGVNFLGAKNLVGTTNQAAICICDTGFLQTLTPHLIAEGFSEIIKHALLAPSPLLELLKNRPSPLALDGLAEIIFETVKEKKRIVEMDELETGERRKLNLGHTIGHAIEGALAIPHGHAVSIGTVFECHLSLKRNLLSTAQLDEIKSLFRKYELPIEIGFTAAEVKRLVVKDKKRFGSTFAMPLLTDLGNSELFEVSEQELFSCIDELAAN